MIKVMIAANAITFHFHFVLDLFSRHRECFLLSVPLREGRPMVGIDFASLRLPSCSLPSRCSRHGLKTSLNGMRPKAPWRLRRPRTPAAASPKKRWLKAARGSSGGPARTVRLLCSGAVVVAVVLPGQRRARPQWRRAMLDRAALLLRGARAVAAIRARLPAELRAAGAAAQPRADDLDARP